MMISAVFPENKMGVQLKGRAFLSLFDAAYVGSTSLVYCLSSCLLG